MKVDYDERPHDVLLRADHPELYTPEKVNPAFPNETGQGDPDAALAAAAVSVDATYTTPPSTTTRWSRTRPSPSGSTAA